MGGGGRARAKRSIGSTYNRDDNSKNGGGMIIPIVVFVLLECVVFKSHAAEVKDWQTVTGWVVIFLHTSRMGIKATLRLDILNTYKDAHEKEMCQ